jgi:hypothetical protein
MMKISRGLVEHLLSNSEALSSTPVLPKKKKSKKVSTAINMVEKEK